MKSSYTLRTVEVERQTSPVRGSTVSFHDINYFVNAPATDRRCSGCCCTASKQILHDVSGIFRPGLNAIMGATGSGKTTLLDALAGRTEPSDVKGTIFVDGQRPPSNFKFMTGYVIQDDVVMGTLTVRENLTFSANLRLPNSLSQKDKFHRVEQTLQELDLVSCADTKVGTEFIRGVSGGERKRTNIGMELIISPNILFLDEPTTGLDSRTAITVISLLRRLSRRDRAVILSIHQPRYTIFKMFDRLSLLEAGHCVFHGQASQALPFFESLGYVCEEHDNPADFFLDVLHENNSTAIQQDNKEDKADDSSVATEGQSTINDSTAPVDEELPVKFYASSSNTATESAVAAHIASGAEETCVVMEVQSTANDKTASLAQYISAKFSASRWAKETNEELALLMATFDSSKQNVLKEVTQREQYATSFLTQLRYVSKRTLLNFVRNPQTSLSEIFMTIFIAVLLGIIYLHLDDSYPAGLQNRHGVMFFVIVHQMFSMLSNVAVFIQERVIFIHECASGFYRVSAYFFATIFCNFMLLRLIPLCIFTVIIYFMIGFQFAVAKFFIFFLTLFLVTLCAAAVCFAASATVRVFALANLLAVCVFIFMMIFGGLLVNIAALDDWLSWLQYFSVTRYSINALSINELNGMTFYVTDVNGTTDDPQFSCTNVLRITGSTYLTQQGIAHDTAWDLWQNIMALGIIAIGVLFIAYIQLRRIKKLK